MRRRWVLLVIEVCVLLLLVAGTWAAAGTTDSSHWLNLMLAGWFAFVILNVWLATYLLSDTDEDAPKAKGAIRPDRRRISMADRLPPDTPPELRKMLSEFTASDLTDLKAPRTSIRTMENDFKVKQGGGILMRVDSPAEARASFEQTQHAPLALMDMGIGYVFQLRVVGADTEVIGVIVDRGGVLINVPAAARLPEALRDRSPLDGLVRLYTRTEDIVTPSSSFAEMWSDYLRVHLYKDTEMRIKADDEVVLKPKRRGGPAPHLLFPDERLLTPPPIVQLRVDDTADAYEVVVELPAMSTAKLAYKASDRELILTVTTSKVVETTKGIKEERRKNKYRLSLPEPIVPRSASGRRYKDTFRVHALKAGHDAG